MSETNEPVLCYVCGPWAYFTTRPLADQWGDDWDDAPYEHNAGTPYEWRESDGIGCLCNGPGGYLAYGGTGTQAPCGKTGHVPLPPIARWDVVRVAWAGDFDTPADGAPGGNSRYAVRDINAGAVPWLAPSRWGAQHDTRIMAGTPLPEFIARVQQAGGTAYLPAAMGEAMGDG